MTWEVYSPAIQQIQFSNDGRWFLGYNETSTVLVLDAFSGAKQCEIKTDGNGRSMACFSGDSKYVAVGNEANNSIIIADVKTGEMISELKGQPRVPEIILWNMEYAVIASACQNLLLWVPDYSNK